MPHVTEPQVVYRAIYVDRKVRKTDEKHAGRSTLLYELDLKAANMGHTHTHTHKVSTVTLVRMRAER